MRAKKTGRTKKPLFHFLEKGKKFPGKRGSVPLELCRPVRQSACVRFALFFLCAHFALADEGLWLYNQFPSATVKTKRGFDVDSAFLDHLRLSSLKIGESSGAFVSPSGLLLTNRQTAGACLASHSTSQHDYFRDGFQAADPSVELLCPGLEANVLVRIQEVTGPVKAAGQNLAQRNATVAHLEKECAAKTAHVCSVVRLFYGGRYDLYEYKRYGELRLVFAPEYAAAFFGAERDSISYLRYGLNIAFLRAYENGKPALITDYLKWSRDGVQEGDLVFLGGNPGPTGRLSTAAQLAFYRDTALPLSLARIQPRVQQLNTFAALSPENLRAAQPILSALLMRYKTEAGKLIGLRDDRLSTRKTVFEGKVRRTVEGNSKLGAEAGKVWDEVAAAYKKWTPLEKPYQILEGNPAPGSRLFAMARAIVRGQPVADSGEPVHGSLEAMMLAAYLNELLTLGEKELTPKTLLGGMPAQQAAEKMVTSTKLNDPLGPRQLKAPSDDPLIALAALVDPIAQRLRNQREEIIGNLEVTATEKIAEYRLKLFGAADYPDGTSTPRVAYGVVKSYIDRASVAQPFVSTISGMFYRKDNGGPYLEPQRWVDAKDAIDPLTPLDFVSTSDIGGGDYGSPVVNRKGELVGVTFDGNLESLPVTYLYNDEQARAVHVDARGILATLNQIYHASGLLQELENRTTTLP
jgi:hypothetical protein